MGQIVNGGTLRELSEAEIAAYLAPDDLATIYDIKPLYSSGIDGSGQKIVIVGRADLDLADEPAPIKTSRDAF